MTTSRACRTAEPFSEPPAAARGGGGGGAAMPEAKELNSRRTLEEITARVEEALNSYEHMEDDNPEQFAGVRRKTEVEATYAELAKAGRARVDVYVVALNEIAAERQKTLIELREKLENERQQAEDTEREERRGRSVDDGDEEAMDETQLLERIDTLEALQRRLANTGTTLLDHNKKNSAGPLIKALRAENEVLSIKAEDLQEKRLLLISELSDRKDDLKKRDNDLRELREEVRSTKEKLALANARAKEAKAMQAPPSKRESLKSDAPARQVATTDAGVGTASEPLDEPATLAFPSPSPGAFDAQLANLESLVDSIGEQLRDDFRMPDATVASLEALLLDYTDAVRNAHTSAMRNAASDAAPAPPPSPTADEAREKRKSRSKPAAERRTSFVSEEPTRKPQRRDSVLEVLPENEEKEAPAPPPPPSPPTRAESRRDSLATRRGSLRGSDGLENETSRAQKALFEAKRELAAESEELSRVRQALMAERQQLSELMQLSQDAKDGADAEAQERLRALDEQMAQSFKKQPERPREDVSEAAKEQLAAAMRGQDAAEKALRRTEEESVRKLELLKEAMSDEHTIDLEDAEELRVVSVQVLAAELDATELELGMVEERVRERLLAQGGAAAGAVAAEAMAAAEADRVALEERIGQLEAAAKEGEKELAAAKEQLAAAAAQKSTLESDLKDAQEAVKAVGGGAAELLEARKEISRLKVASSSAEAAQALQMAEREEIISRARELGRAEGEASIDAAVTERTKEMEKRIAKDAAAFNALHGEIEVADTARKDAEAAVIEISARSSASNEWARQRVAETEAYCEAKLTAALSSRAAAAEAERESRRATTQRTAALEEGTKRLRSDLVSAHEKIRSLNEKLHAASKAPSTRRQELPIEKLSAPAPGAPAAGEALSPERNMAEEAPPPVENMSQEEQEALFQRTQRQLLEVAALTEFEHKILLGDDAQRPGTAPSATSDKPTVVASGSGKLVAGSGSRIAWLLREGIGHTTSMGIRGAVRPATRPMDNQHLRRALRALFSQQRSLASQSAIGNWELLGAMVLLRPKQLYLQTVHDGMVAEVNEGEVSEVRRAELTMQLPRVSALSSQREQQRKWCCQVWDLRRQAVGTVTSRLMSQTLYALTKLTDAVNTQPANGSISPSVHARAPSPRAKKHDALATAIFGAPPIMPFVMPPRSGTLSALARPAEDWADWTASTGVPAASHEMWGRGNGLTTEQMQRLVVAAQHWPADYSMLGTKLQRQVLAEAVAYCISGAVQPDQPPPLTVPAAPPSSPEPGDRPTSPRPATALAGSVPTEPRITATPQYSRPRPPSGGHRPPSGGRRPETAPNTKEMQPQSPRELRIGPASGLVASRQGGAQAGHPVVLKGRPAASAPREIFSR